MAYEAFPLNLKLTEAGYQRVFHGFGNPVNIKYIAIGTGLDGRGYAVEFRENATALKTEVLRKQIDASQIIDTIDPDTGNPCKRVDYAAMFSSNLSIDVREVGFFSEDGVLIYVWSSTEEEAFAPIRPKLSLVVSIAQYLLIQEEMKVINVVDAGYPLELFIQPLQDQLAINKESIKEQLLNEIRAEIQLIESVETSQLALASIRQTLVLDNHGQNLSKQNLAIATLQGWQSTAIKQLEKLGGDTQLLLLPSLQSRLNDHDLAMYSAMLARRRILSSIWQPGLIECRASGKKGDAWMVEFEPDHVSFAINGIHDHADIVCPPDGVARKMAFTMGTPELSIYLHEQIQTRHLDPVLVTPKIGSENFLETEIVKAPPIPPAILAKSTPDEQIAEAKEWMRAFVMRDPSIRDYRPYVDVHLLVMEAWDQVTAIEDASLSFRHGEEESGVYDIHAASAIYQVTGAKPILENKTSPVSSIVAHKNSDGTVITTVCRMHTTRLGNIGEYNPDECLYINDDAGINYRTGKIQEESDPNVHYGVCHTIGGGKPIVAINHETLINKWMRKVSGLSNGKNIPFELSEPNQPVYQWVDPTDKKTVMNAGYYTNYYSLPDDAVGRNIARTGFSDASKWVSINDRPEVVPWVDPHTKIEYRVSYAVPWEVVLVGWWNNVNWNPRKIPYKTSKTARYGGITGNGTLANPFNGWNEDHRGCVLPYELFDADSVKSDPADTGKGKVYALDKNGEKQEMCNAGIRAITLSVAGYNRRCRYPIMPIAWQKNPIYRRFKIEKAANDFKERELAMSSIRQTLKIESMRRDGELKAAELQSIIDEISVIKGAIGKQAAESESNAADIESLALTSIRQTININKQ